MEMIKNSPQNCYATVQRMTLIILQRLNQVLALEGQLQNNSERAQVTDLQSLLCATLQVNSWLNDEIIFILHSLQSIIFVQSVLRKVTPEDAPQISDEIMTALLQMFTSSQSGSVQEDAMMAVTALIQVLRDGFLKYMDSFKPFLYLGLKNFVEHQVRYHFCVCNS